MTVYRILSLLCAAFVLILGGIYLTVGDASLSYVLPLCAIAFWGVAALQYADTRAAGAKGILAILPALATSLVAAFATLGALVYIIK